MQCFVKVYVLLVLGISLGTLPLKADWQNDLKDAIKQKQEAKALSIIEQHKQEIRSARPINQSDRSTFLHEAALEGLANVANALVLAGADMQAEDSERRIPLDYAVLNGHMDVTRNLIEHARSHGVDLINRRGHAGRTRLHTAVDGMHPEVVRYLLEQGADRNVRADGQTPLDLAREHERQAGFYTTVHPIVEILERPSRINLVQEAQRHFQAAQQQQANTGVLARISNWWHGGGSN